MRKVVTEEVIKHLKYISNCTICGNEYETGWISEVNKKCPACKKEMMNKAIEYLKTLGLSIDYDNAGRIDYISFRFEDSEYAIDGNGDGEYDMRIYERPQMRSETRSINYGGLNGQC